MTRRQRRAAGAEPSNAQISSAADIPLSRPDTIRAPGKTLLEIAAERQTQLQLHGQPLPKSNDTTETQFVTISPSGKVTETSPTNPRPDDADSLESVSPILDTVFLALPLACLHFTLSFLTVHQYAPELKVLPIILNTIFVAFPTLTLVIHLFHGHLFGVNLSTVPRLQEAAPVLQQI